jgi:hypothetical protein
MGGDDSQKLLPWRGTYSSPGRSKPPAHYENITLPQMAAPPRSTMRRGAAHTAWGHFWKAEVGHF